MHALRLVAATSISILMVLGLAGAATHPDFPAALSQLDWMRSQDAKFDEWGKGDAVVFWGVDEATDRARGWHPVETTDCDLCHDGIAGTHMVYPDDTQTEVCGRQCHYDDIADLDLVDFSAFPFKMQGTSMYYPCGTACHGWLKSIDEEGFPNLDPALQGDTRYTGPIQPLYLLNYSKDMDGDGRDHKLVYETFGCQGFCHNEAVTIEQAELWGADGTEPGVPPGDVHGELTTCTNCHRYESPWGGPTDLHTTHIPFVTLEKPLGDPFGPPTGTTCDYCHDDGEGSDGPAGGGCYNCHLSGHRPETYYWAALPAE